MVEQRPWLRYPPPIANVVGINEVPPIDYKASDLSHANLFLDHAKGCDCSTCLLVAKLRRLIRDRDRSRP